TIDDLTERFAYCFDSSGGYPAILNACAITEAVRLAPEGEGAALSVEPLPVEHGGVPGVSGYRLEAGGQRAGYVPDANGLPADTAARLA
ncbi:MAG: MBL fold metallo-hydrolase, partial [Actinobacteria bacterium]|nr:MBL fold metallo-hydrolase [Actinomycetota bacterium]NIU17606.1 MBL fold metallo-hydrolase [Actinomycetota bacterium]NIU64899.1 MBL fold metallo-hydrolase [Actinomycetota bacterium]NIV54102.1 MBL fold metallo-hydrolase [Actinomycetota bacterium]NIV85384.1 MBL fold metallo-hydrolase [Actinomycetota bacterium]